MRIQHRDAAGLDPVHVDGIAVYAKRLGAVEPLDRRTTRQHGIDGARALIIGLRFQRGQPGFDCARMPASHWMRPRGFISSVIHSYSSLISASTIRSIGSSSFSSSLKSGLASALPECLVSLAAPIFFDVA